jgi:Ca2+-binding RTX toxin-like protein
MAVTDYFGNALATSASPINNFSSLDPLAPLTGTASADKLVSNGTGEVMTGLGGDDTYCVKSAGDVVVEAANGGIDTVIVSNLRSYVLGANVENLTISGKSWGFGNDLANIIVGGSNDQVLNGGKGDDVLTGGAGADTFVFQPGSGHDVITDFNVTDGDQIRIDGYALANFDQVKAAMTQVGSDVVLKLSATDSVKLANVSASSLTANSFQLDVNTSALKMTFDDEFNSLSLARNSDGLGGTWKTNFDFGIAYGTKSLSSHTLLNNEEQEIYVSPDYAGDAVKGTAGLGINPFSVQDGVLTITAEKTPDALKGDLWNMPYTSGLLTTQNSFAQQYGYFEIKAALPQDHGAWPAFWLLPADGTNPLELDVMENVGGDMAYQTAHFSDAFGAKTKESFANFVSDPGSFHTYGMLWTAKEVAWYIDGVEVSSMPTPTDMNKPMFMLVNLAVGGNWAGAATFDSTEMKVDYVHAYSVDPNATAADINPDAIAAATPPPPPPTPTGTDTTTSSNPPPPPPPPSTPPSPTVVGSTSGILGTDGTDTLKGGTSDDTIYGQGGDDLLRGGLGNDHFDGGAGNDTVTYNNAKAGVSVDLAVTGAQTVSAGQSETLVSIENLTGSSYDDHLSGDGGANVLSGSGGNDLLTGRAGDDTLIGGGGDDVLIGGPGNDVLDGGWGTDTASYADAGSAVTVRLSIVGPQNTGGAGVDTLIKVENVVGSAYADTLVGNDGNNVLDGGKGADVLIGGAGADVLIGGAGADTMTGGTGADTFVIKSTADSTMGSPDVITDFHAKELDVVDLSGIDANTSAAGDQAFTFVGTAAFTHHAGELRYSVDAAGAHVMGDVNGDGVADFQVILSGVTTLTSGNFVL